MTTPWTLPSVIDQYCEPGAELAHVSWLDTDNFFGLKTRNRNGVETSADLMHISRSPKHDILQKTYFLRAMGFNFENIPEVINGIELKMIAQRRGRITDETVQLCVNGQAYGDNLATLAMEPETVYGGNSIVWGLKNLSAASLVNFNFGIILRMQSHPRWPHRDPMLINSVELRLH